jgi:hypothetical protein
MQIKKIVDEHTEQVNYFKMLNKLIGKYPELILAYAVPNGGLRNKIVAKKLKAEGTKSGVPDIHIPIPSLGYHGLYIEMKKIKGWSVTENQKFWINYLNDLGYKAFVCKGALSAFATTDNYLKGTDEPIERYTIDRSKFNKKDGLNKIYQSIALKKGYCE